MLEFEDSFESSLTSLRNSLTIEHSGTGKANVFFHPLPRLGSDGEPADDTPTPVQLLQVDVLAGHLTMFPTNNLTLPSREVVPKYSQIKRISFAGGKVVFARMGDTLGQDEVSSKYLGSYFGKTEPVPLPEGEQVPDVKDTVPTSVEDVIDLLHGLPSYCVKDPHFGLGLKRQFRHIVQTIELLSDAVELHIANDCSTAYLQDSKVFVLSASEMESLTKAIEQVDRTTRTAANSVNETSTFNTLADAIGQSKRPLRYGRKELRKTLTAIANGERPLSHLEQNELVETLTSNASAIQRRDPATMEGLEFGIALARAKGLHDDLERMLGTDLPEKEWQRFLRANPFVLSLVFGRPIIKVGDQASVGGKTISGGGDKIADFLVRNSLTNNAALVEIKTPKTKLLNRSPYRQSVFTPAGELVGAINQVLDQKNRFEQDIANIRNQNRRLNVEAHHVHACVLIGMMPSGQYRIRSFELFRSNLKDVVVVTFDELARKVKDLCFFLEGKNHQPEIPPAYSDFDVPF